MQPQPVNETPEVGKSYDTIVVGGGQAGLATGYFLSRRKNNFVILDENPRTGASWRKRWDSLRLFTPSPLDGLPGMRFPADENYFPTKDELAGYLEQYAQRFQLPIQHGVKVDRVTRDDGTYSITATGLSLTTRNVVIATGPYRLPRIPAFASQLEEAIHQFHSSAYCNPGQVRGQTVLVVGAGNSGAEIALELALAGKQVWLAGRDVGVLPIGKGTSGISGAFGGRPAWWLMRRILNVNTPIGRRARVRFIHQGHPLGRARRQQLAEAGIELVGRVSGVDSGKPRLEDGRVLPVDSVIWATGFRPDYSWIDLPIFDEDGLPRHHRGAVSDAPGLYFVGLPYQTAFSSALLGGVGADAAYIASHIAHRTTAA